MVEARTTPLRRHRKRAGVARFALLLQKGRRDAALQPERFAEHRNQADKKETKDHLASRGGNFRTEQSFFAAVRSTLLRRRVFAPEGNRLLANGRSNPFKEP